MIFFNLLKIQGKNNSGFLKSKITHICYLKNEFCLAILLRYKDGF